MRNPEPESNSAGGATIAGVSPGARPAQDPDRMPVEQPAAPSRAPAPAKKRSIRAGLLPLILLGAIGAGGWYGYQWWTEGRFIVSTDDAYVGAEMATISSKLSANVASVNFSADQSVKPGDVLLKLDDGDFRLALEAAKAKSATGTATLARIDAQIAAAVAGLASDAAQSSQAAAQADQAESQMVTATADMTRAQSAYERAQSLIGKNITTQANLDQVTADRSKGQAGILAATAAKATAAAAIEAANAAMATAKANIEVLRAQRSEAAQTLAELKIAEDKAARDLDFTTIRASIDGVMATKTVQLGDFVSPGKRLAAIVPLANAYVEANFKETQIGGLKLGDPVTMTVDALPDRHFVGTVIGINPGTGSVFSLLPPDNATGNFTKIVQRLPVRIGLPDEMKGLVRPGQSVTVSFDSRLSRKD